MASEEDLSDYDIHLIMEALSTRQSKVVASCALSIKLLLTEIQQQLLDLMVEGRLADTPVSHSSAAEEEFSETSVFQDPASKPDAPANSETPSVNTIPSQETVVTGPVVPITGSLIKSPNSYACSNCDMVFSTKKALSRHSVEHNMNAEVETVAETLDCNPSPTKNGVQIDQSAHAITSKEEEPSEPQKLMLTLPKRSTPKTRSHSSATRATCVECGTQTLKQHMARHMLSHSGQKPFSCEKCGSSFTRKDKLKEHMRKHEESNIVGSGQRRSSKTKISKCRKCDFETENKQEFKEHRKTHPSKTLYKCEDCDKEFHCPSHLEQHSIKHRNEKPYMCDMCGVSFSREPNLARHIRSHTSPAPYNCKFCNKPYHRNNELIVHERTHTGEKPYICEICGNGYASSKYLKRHLFTHTGLKPFKCDLCERAFARPENMRAHRKLHEKPSSRLTQSSGDTIASAFHVSQIESMMGEDTAAEGLSSPHNSVADFYQFSAAATIPVTNGVSSAPTSDNESIMQSFKISDDL
ncbi:zinc finger protein OZF-like [Watersipora subatra]|uniref:zinc finger protein OZF-like n=1 Tax=Watersipora subatra TaxID=2589382 RepID=UPI00355C1980